VHQHGRTGVAQAAQRAAGHHLQAIEQLEDRGNAQEHRSRANHRCLAYIEAHDPSRHDGQRQARRAHEERTQEQRGPSGDGGAANIAAAVGLPHAHRGGGADSQRHHVGGGNHVHGDCVGRQGNFVEPRDHSGHDGEDRALEQDLAGGRQSQLDEAANARRRRPPGDAEQPVSGAALVPQDGAQQNGGHVGARERSGKRRPRDAHGRHAPVAEHQHPVAGGVHQVGGHQRESHRFDDVHRLQIAAESGVEQQRPHAPQQVAHERAEHFHDARIHTRGAQHRNQRPQNQRHDGGERGPQPDAVHQCAAGIPRVVGAERLGHQGVHAQEHAGAANGYGPKNNAAQAAGTHRGRA